MESSSRPAERGRVGPALLSHPLRQAVKARATIARMLATVEFLGGVGTVTGSKFVIERGDRRVMLDCGLFQGLKELRQRNWTPLPVEPRSVATVVLTHAHIDHTGYLPRFCRDGFAGKVYATRATADLARIMLPDSGHLQEEEAAYHNKRGSSKHAPALPLYTAEDGLAAAVRVSGVAYDRPLALDADLQVSFARAGHIIGSAIVTMDLGAGDGQRRVVFSGDVGRRDAPILPDPAPIGAADYIVVESTYGDRRHDPAPVAEHLERTILAAVQRGGPIVVPAFAVGRAQELLYYLCGLRRAGRIPALPTYLDSPMAVDATGIYWTHPEEFDDEMRRLVFAGQSPFEYSDLHMTRDAQASKALNDLDGSILVIAASGMATGGRILHHLHRRLPDPRATVLLVGYQAEGTRGRLLQDGAKTLRIFGDDVRVRAHVETIHGLSAHADADGLVAWLRTATTRPRRVFVVHGDPEPARTLAARVRDELGWDAVVPAYRDRLPID
jgi:metallo-beta-lactamase family protein